MGSSCKCTGSREKLVVARRRDATLNCTELKFISDTCSLSHSRFPSRFLLPPRHVQSLCFYLRSTSSRTVVVLFSYYRLPPFCRQGLRTLSLVLSFAVFRDISQSYSKIKRAVQKHDANKSCRGYWVSAKNIAQPIFYGVLILYCPKSIRYDIWQYLEPVNDYTN